jgi:hypothetical protein
MTWHIAHEGMLVAARMVRDAAKGQHAKELSRLAEELRNLAQPVMLDGDEEVALRLVDLANEFDGHGGISRAIARDELSSFLPGNGLIHCNTHGESPWIGDVLCKKCLRFYEHTAIPAWCECGDRLLGAGSLSTARPLCHECAKACPLCPQEKRS